MRPFFSLNRPPVYTTVTFDLTGALEAFPEEALSTVGWVFTPPSVPSEPVVLLCFPGIGYNKAYYHMEISGFDVYTYSFATEMADRGYIVICLDPLGIGESSTPDGTRLNLAVMATANTVVTRQIQERLRAGALCSDLPPLEKVTCIGIGHGLGAFLLVEQQAQARSFAALALLGYTNSPIAPFLKDEITQCLYPGLLQNYQGVSLEDWEAFAYGNNIPPDEILEAEGDCFSEVPLAVWEEIQKPELMLPRAAAIDVPVFLANADLDLSADFFGEPATYPASRDITLLRLAESGHCHHFAPTRHLLWKRLALWCQAQTTIGGAR